MRQSVNTGPVVPDGFAVALSCAIEASGLTLDRLQHRLAQRGVGVSLSTLSYWRRGRSRPERPQSIKAVRVLEEALVSLLGAPRPRGRWLRGPMQRTLELESLWSFDTESAANALSQIEQQPPERLTFMSIHDELNIDAEGKESRIRVRSVVRAEAPGVDRIQITHRADATDLDAPRITAINHGRRGRVHCIRWFWA